MSALHPWPIRIQTLKHPWYALEHVDFKPDMYITLVCSSLCSHITREVMQLHAAYTHKYAYMYLCITCTVYARMYMHKINVYIA